MTYDDESLSAGERAGLERTKDLLVRIAGDRAMRRLDPLDPAETAFVEWYAREARATLSVAERYRLEANADRFVRSSPARSPALRDSSS